MILPQVDKAYQLMLATFSHYFKVFLNLKTNVEDRYLQILFVHIN